MYLLGNTNRLLYIRSSWSFLSSPPSVLLPQIIEPDVSWNPAETPELVLKCFYCNGLSLPNKVQEFEQPVLGNEPRPHSLTESQLTTGHYWHSSLVSKHCCMTWMGRTGRTLLNYGESLLLPFYSTPRAFIQCDFIFLKLSLSSPSTPLFCLVCRTYACNTQDCRLVLNFFDTLTVQQEVGNRGIQGCE